ncbi:MAG: HD domain-containing protein [candidate division Zixibacteria bacterium]|nr:HD domain-containing protein [candidate division Zixibacteria bacterium]
MKDIVVIDDEIYICNIIIETLDCFDDCRVHQFTDPVEAATHISKNNVDLVLTDLVMGDYSGVEILETTLKNHPDAVVILMTGYPTVKTAISVLRKGGYDYLVKPFKLEDLKATIMRGLEHQRIKRENVELRSQVELMKIAEAMADGVQLKSLLNLIAKSAVRELPAKAASIVLFDPMSGEGRIKSIYGTAGGNDVEAFLHGESPQCRRTMTSLHPEFISEEMNDNDSPYHRTLVSFPLVSKRMLLGLLNVIYDNRFMEISTGQKRLVSLLASKAASAIEANNLHQDLQHSYLQTIASLANAIEARDHYTAGHTDRVYHYAEVLARQLNWSDARLNQLRNGCLLHDIGKIGIPDNVLNKPGFLTVEERKIMEQHPELGARILSDVPFLEPIIPYILTHHERYDGTGYPQGLKGEDIPMEGRLLAVADTFDAITSDRPYRQGRAPELAIEELVCHRGTQFDPHMVDLFVSANERGLVRVEHSEKMPAPAPLNATV